MGKLKSVLIMAGGTGGHVFPGLAVANYLKERGIEINWLGTEKGLEARLVPHAGIPIYYVPIGGVRGKNWKTKLFAPWKLFIAVISAIKIIHRLNPDIVLGMGGFASGPGGLAAWLLRKKLVIHEQNAKPGMTNRCLALFATKVLEGFPQTFKQSKKIVTVGNPVRKEIIKLSAKIRQNKEVRLLVLGGSLGAEAINRLLPLALMRLPEVIRPIVCHQTGEKHYDQTLKAYKDAGVSAEIVPFIIEMDKAYDMADIALCRAGALTIAELCAAGLGAILIPYPHAVDDHQTTNAQFMVENGAAILVQQALLTDELLASLLQDLCESVEKRIAMSKAAYKLRRIDASEKVVEICESLVMN
jgi:UDP-N-acetylglucosamine--N-acetylmuramyl-(pentapeptide) pyrophosphoryl-undecaprenol N-acetylglucosamine transferase